MVPCLVIAPLFIQIGSSGKIFLLSCHCRGNLLSMRHETRTVQDYLYWDKNS